MATVTVSASTTLALLTYAADDDIFISPSGSALVTLTCNSNPNALPAIRSIRSTSARAVLRFRNSATAFSAGNLWRPTFTNPGAAIGAGNGTIGLSGGFSVEFDGEWLECYTATGVASETVLDASNVLGVDIDFPYAIQAESAPGSGVWDWVRVAIVGGVGNGFLTATAQTDYGLGEVGRCLFYNQSTRLLKTGDGTNGVIFAAGTKFRIHNIWPYIPPFTLTTAAGWTTGTGSQPVVSSTNAPLTSYLVGSEVVSVNSLPGGTSVNVNTRSQDGTTAAAHAAGLTMYAHPSRSVSAMAGKIGTGQSGGNLLIRKTTFGRWFDFDFRFLRTLTLSECAIVKPGEGFSQNPTNIDGSIDVENSLIYVAPNRGLLGAFLCSNNTCDIDISGISVIANYLNLTATGSGNLITITGNPKISRLKNQRAHLQGIPAAPNVNTGLVQISANSYVDTAVSGVELIGGQLQILTADNINVSGIRYSSTNGAANVAMTDTAVSLSSQGSPTSRCVIRDFDVLSGGLAPRTRWIAAASGGVLNCVLHNQVGGSVGSRGAARVVDCQSRTAAISQGGAGFNIVAAMYMANMRSSGPTMGGVPFGVVRNVRQSSTGGSIVAGASVTYDMPPGFDTTTPSTDTQAIYAYPAAYPATTGTLQVGPFGQQVVRTLYSVSGSAYYDPGNFRFGIETSGDVVTVFSAVPVTGIASIPSTGSVTVNGTNATSGITYEFRLCNWGADITAVSWATFDRATFKTAFDALTGYTSENGLNVQIRATATTSVAGRNWSSSTMPININGAHNPAVGTVPLGLIGANAGATAAFYATFYTAEGLLGSATTDGSGAASLSAPYDYDDVPITYRIKVRALEGSSVDVTGTYTQQGATAPTPQQALTGYVAGPYAGASFNKATKVVTVSSAMTTQELWSAWREYIVQLANFNVDDEWTYPELDAGTWEVAFSGAGSITGSYTDVNGTRAPVTAPNLPIGARVQFYDDTNNVELTNTVLASPGASTSLYFTTPVTIRLRAAKLGSLPIEAFGVMSASGLTFIDSFVTDDVYVAKGIDGSTVTEFSADEPNVQIDSNDPDGVSSVWRCYAWFRYYETSSIGVAGVLFGAAQAIDTENLAIDSARADIQLDNVSAVPLKISDGYMYRTDGATIIAPTSGSIQMDPKKAYSATGGGGGATAEEIWTHPSRTLVPVGGVTNLY